MIYKCEICTTLYKCSSELIRHCGTQKHLRILNEKNNQNADTNKINIQVDESTIIAKKEKQNTKFHKCDVCNTVYRGSYDLNRHLKTNKHLKQVEEQNISKLENVIIKPKHNGLPNPSEEQKIIIKNLKDHNIVVDAVAGAGKTTVSLLLASEYPDKNILLLTYNKKLKEETREKIIKYNIKNMEIHSYHSFSVKYYFRESFTDKGIKEFLKKHIEPKSKFNYDIIIIDEAQDISNLYYQLICKIYDDNVNKKARLCILGDKFQSIYAFNDADPRFIMLANEIFNFNKDPWLSTTLSTSFRITNSIALFINKCLLNSDRLKANKNGDKIRYLICDAFDKNPYDEVMHYLNNGYKNDDIFILAPSVKSEQSPIRQLANKLSTKGIKIYVPNSDEEKIDEDILRGKICFSSFHQVKGLERKVVIVYNFDDSYFAYFKRNADNLICPNEIYVACTRALEHLTVIHHYENNYLPFLNRYKLEECCKINKCQKLEPYKKGNKNQIDTNVTDLVRHISVDVIEKSLSYIDIKEINPIEEVINIDIKTQQGDFYEAVSEINGIAIPSYFELKKTGKMTIFSEECMNYKPVNERNNKYMFISNDDYKSDDELDDNFNDIDLKTITPEQLLYIANKWNMYKTKLSFKIDQIEKYDWLNDKQLTKCIERLNKHISNNIVFEKHIITHNKPELLNRKLNGFIDCIDTKTKIIWEFKCVTQLDDTHKLQLAIYMYQFLEYLILNNVSHINDYRFYLFNILNNNIIEIKSSIIRLREMIKYLINVKYQNVTTISNEKFKEKCDNIREIYFKFQFL